MIGRSFSMGILGLEAFSVEVEADLTQGMPGFDLVGLPDTAVRESRNRVKSAIKNCGFEFPISKITMNLAPADKKKEGPIYDLPLLIALLKVTGQLTTFTDDSIFLGELSLNGDVRTIQGVLPMTIKAQKEGFKKIYVPYGNALEACVVKDMQVYPVKNIFELVEHLRGINPITPAVFSEIPVNEDNITYDFSDVKGQLGPKRALEIAASGGHNAILVGSPGSGKSMLAKRITSILPDMTFEESIQTTEIHSVAGILTDSLVRERPYRSPHHTISANGLSGGGTIPKPGEISLAHNGVLFLDEFPEYSKNSMEILRQPLEDGKITISRVFGTVTYPCNVLFIAAMNPCPCGYYGHPTRKCTCSPTSVSRYLSKISGPLLDRIDLHIEVEPVEYRSISSKEKGESSKEIKERVNFARKIQEARYLGTGITCNANATGQMIAETAHLSKGAEDLMAISFDRYGFTGRTYDRILKVSRTIADLANSETVEKKHMLEAIMYRSLDKKYWNRGI